MEIIIGRQGNQRIPLTDASISRRHAVLTVDPATKAMRLRDNSSINGTWILGNDGQFRRLTGETTVGPDTSVRFGATVVVKIKDLVNLEPPTVDISHLKEVYETYNENKLSIEAKQSNIMMLRMASMSGGAMLGVIFSMLIPDDLVGDRIAEGFLKGLTMLVSLVVAWIIVDRKNKDLIKQKNQNEIYLKEHYSCPKCGFHFGPKVYTNILAEGRCPNNNCKVRFKGQ